MKHLFQVNVSYAVGCFVLHIILPRILSVNCLVGAARDVSEDCRAKNNKVCKSLSKLWLDRKSVV